MPTTPPGKCERCGSLTYGYRRSLCSSCRISRVQVHESRAFSRRYGTSLQWNPDDTQDPGWDNVVRAYEEDR